MADQLTVGHQTKIRIPAHAYQQLGPRSPESQAGQRPDVRLQKVPAALARDGVNNTGLSSPDDDGVLKLRNEDLELQVRQTQRHYDTAMETMRQALKDKGVAILTISALQAQLKPKDQPGTKVLPASKTDSYAFTGNEPVATTDPSGLKVADRSALLEAEKQLTEREEQLAKREEMFAKKEEETKTQILVLETQGR